MDIRKIEKLIELAKTTGVTELEIREGEETVRISLAPATVSPAAHTHHLPITTEAPAPHTAVPTKQEKEVTGHTVKSPMVGTVYLAPTPGAKPFVEVGQHVEAGATLCMIEAMKMFNQIEADRAGVINARLVDNQQAVEYDQPLFLIEAV